MTMRAIVWITMNWHFILAAVFCLGFFIGGLR